MGNYRLLFYGTQESKTDQTNLQIFANIDNEISIFIESDGIDFICLDKPTAIRLVRELKKQIGFLENI